MKSLRVIRLVAWAAVVVLGVAVAAIAYQWQKGGNSGLSGVASATIGGPFKLTDQNGNTVTEAALQGHPSALYFGYTFCPDICPTTLFDISDWLKQLGPDGDKLKVFFITVDPERDTQKQMAAYLEAFDPRITGLTGPRPAIDKMLKEFRIYARKVPLDGGGYTMDHTASIYLMNDKGVFTSAVDYKDDTNTVMKKLHRLIDNS